MADIDSILNQLSQAKADAVAIGLSPEAVDAIDAAIVQVESERPLPDPPPPGDLVFSVASGSWMSGSTWSTGQVPVAGDKVVIAADHTVVLAANVVTERLISVDVFGFLDVMSTLRVKDLVVHPAGKLVCWPGAEIVFLDMPPGDEEQLGTGLIVYGILSSSGFGKTPFMRLEAEPVAGQEVLLLDGVPTGWQVGDELILPDTRQPNVRTGTISHTDRCTIAAIDGQLVTLTAPLIFDHLGARNAAGEVEFLPHVLNMTRSVVFRSENPAGTCGHVLITERAEAYVAYTQFIDLGRTTVNPIDPVVNHIGRYPLHAHHLIGPEGGTESGYQYKFVGNVIDGGDKEHRFKWGLTIHQSHYGLIAQNVVYNYAGAGIACEDGNETDNVFDGNFVCRVRGDDFQHAESADRGNDGWGFWFRGPFNRVVGNVVADSWTSAYYQFSRTRSTDLPLVESFPTAPGQEPSQYVHRPESAKKSSFTELRNNEAYGCGSAIGLYRNDGTPYYGDVSVIDGLTSWHVNVGYAPVYDGEIEVRNMTVIGDPAGMELHRNLEQDAYKMSCGVALWCAYMGEIRFNNLRIENMGIGIYSDGQSFNRYQTLTVVNLVGNSVGIYALPGAEDASNPGKDLALWDLSSNSLQYEIYMPTSMWLHGRMSRMYVDGEQRFWSQQAADYVISVGDFPAHVRGLTNAQAWEQYGIAVFGAVAPEGAAIGHLSLVAAGD